MIFGDFWWLLMIFHDKNWRFIMINHDISWWIMTNHHPIGRGGNALWEKNSAFSDRASRLISFRWPGLVSSLIYTLSESFLKCFQTLTVLFNLNNLTRKAGFVLSLPDSKFTLSCFKTFSDVNSVIYPLANPYKCVFFIKITNGWMIVKTRVSEVFYIDT